MKLSEKILTLRKKSGWSQEELAERLDVSRQAISRWESGSALPDANNILLLSKLFGVTTDYLLNDDYQSDNDLPKVQALHSDGRRTLFIAMVTLEVMTLILQFMTFCVLQSDFFGLLTFVLFAAILGGFEYGYQKHRADANQSTRHFRKRFYQVSAWLGAYFPIRFLVRSAMHLYPRPYNTLVLDCIILVLYIATALIICLELEKRDLKS